MIALGVKLESKITRLIEERADHGKAENANI